MAEPINIGGVLYEDLGNGQMKVVGYADASAAPSGGRVFTLPPNPKDVRQEARADRRDTLSEEDQRIQRAAADRAEREWNATHNPDGSPKKPLPDSAAKRYEEAIDAFAAYERAVNGFKPDYAGNALTGNLENTAQKISPIPVGTPGQADWWSDFKMTDNMIRNALFGASLTSGEKAAFAETTITPRMNPEQIKINMQRRLELAKEKLQRRGQFLKANGYDPDAVDALAGEYAPLINGQAEQRADNEVPDPTNTADVKAPAGIDTETSLPTGGIRSSVDERLGAQLDSLINAGASEATINEVLRKNNYKPTPGEFSRIKEWMKDNPGQKYFGAAPVREEELGAFQKALANPTVAPWAAGLANYLDTATAGVAGNLAGEDARGNLEAASELNPNASIAGQLAGGVVGTLAGEGAVGAGAAKIASPWLMRNAPRMADVLYGGLYGFNTAKEGEGLKGAVTGAGAGLVGNYLGQKVTAGVGRGLRGVQDANVGYLRGQGVPLTVGQTVSNSGRLGSTVKSVEDALTGMPGVGNMVNARRREGMEGFNSAAFRELPLHPGTTGAQGVTDASQIVDDSYQFLDNTQLPLDAPYAGTEAGIRATVPPRFGDDIIDQLDMSRERVVNGALPGRDWQSAIRTNRTNRADLRGQPYADRAIASHNDIEANLMGLATRQGPADTAANLADANRTFSLSETLASALDNGPAQQADELFTPARLDAAARQGAKTYGGRTASMSGNRPFYDLTTAGRSVLPSSVNDSGTMTRGLVTAGVLGGGGALGGGAMADDAGSGATVGGLGTMLMLAAGGSRPAQRAMVSLLADRPDVLARAGNRVFGAANLGGHAGTAMALPWLTGQ
jgi:hypothetical protein